jgi:hypothetical protein
MNIEKIFADLLQYILIDVIMHLYRHSIKCLSILFRPWCIHYTLTVLDATPQNRWLHSIQKRAKNCIRSIKRKQLLNRSECLYGVYEENNLRD